MLQIFSENQLGPIFFEFIQRKGDDGFGNGNFQALFDSIEQVQDKATRWLWTYNHQRPNMALGGITPMQKLALAA